jgi:hypothetical protein
VLWAGWPNAHRASPQASPLARPANQRSRRDKKSHHKTGSYKLNQTSALCRSSIAANASTAAALISSSPFAVRSEDDVGPGGPRAHFFWRNGDVEVGCALLFLRQFIPARMFCVC